MVVEEPSDQSSLGKAISGYTKIKGYTGILGTISFFIWGSLFLLGGIILSIFISNTFPLVFSVMGLGFIILGFFNIKWSRKMREGKIYQIGKGWVNPR